MGLDGADRVDTARLNRIEKRTEANEGNEEEREMLARRRRGAEGIGEKDCVYCVSLDFLCGRSVFKRVFVFLKGEDR